jgi:hypothetical protein
MIDVVRQVIRGTLSPEQVVVLCVSLLPAVVGAWAWFITATERIRRARIEWVCDDERIRRDTQAAASQDLRRHSAPAPHSSDPTPEATMIRAKQDLHKRRQ